MHNHPTAVSASHQTQGQRFQKVPFQGATFFALPGICIGFAMIILDASLLNVALPAIHRSLGGGMDGLLWIVNGYTLTFATLLLSSGALGDYLGAKPIFLSGLALFTISSLACSLAPSIDLLIAARVLQGGGAAFLAPGSLALLTHSYPNAQERARAVGIWSAVSGVGFAGGPLLGGLLVDAFGWRSIFLVNVPIGLIAFTLTARFVAAPPRTSRWKFDLAGQVLAALTLLPLTYALIEGGQSGWKTPLVMIGCAMAGVAALLFLLVESHSHHPLLPLKLFASPKFSVANIVAFFYNFGLYSLLLVLSLFLQNVQGFSASGTGLTLLPLTLTYLLTSLLIAGRVTARWGPRLPLTLGTASCFLGALVVAWVGKNSSPLVLIAGLILFGFGMGMTMTAMTAAVLSSIGGKQAGVGSAVLNISRQVGGVLGPTLAGTLVSANSVAPGMHLALLIVAGGFSLSLLLTRLAVHPDAG